MRNANKPPILQWRGKRKSDPKLHHHQKLTSFPTGRPNHKTQFHKISWLLLQYIWQTEWQTKCTDCTSSALAEVTIIPHQSETCDSYTVIVVGSHVQHLRQILCVRTARVALSSWVHAASKQIIRISQHNTTVKYYVNKQQHIILKSN